MRKALCPQFDYCYEHRQERGADCDKTCMVYPCNGQYDKCLYIEIRREQQKGE